MIEGSFKIAKKGYPAAWHNQSLAYQQGESFAEAIAAGHFENEAAILRAAYGQRNIRASAKIKDLANKGGTVAEAVEHLRTYKVLAEKQQGGGKGNPEALAAARAAREANKAKAAKMDNLAEAAQKDPRVAKELERLRALGIDI
jgi:hypothetical protein